MVIAKIIQNLANNILFGKELHMVILNDFLKDNNIKSAYFHADLSVSEKERVLSNWDTSQIQVVVATVSTSTSHFHFTMRSIT